MKAAILIPNIASRDAVGADAMAMFRILVDAGIETRIFCDAAGDIGERTYPAERLPSFAGGSGDLVIYHYSMGWKKGIDLLGRCRGFRVVKYHNVTPPEFFEGIADDYVAACRGGRAEIEAIATLGCELYLGASAYNLGELVEAGLPAERGGVLAPFHRIDELADADADLDLIDELDDGARNFLMVGRVAPNKGHVALVDAFAAYVDAYGDPARLVILGKIDPRLSAYTDRIRARVDHHRLGGRVRWINGASEGQLKAAYLASHVFMLLSEHEGFCVPLAESMALGTPIVARATSAIPETLADAGLSWDGADPYLYAASAARVFGDGDLRAALREAASRRYQSIYASRVLRERFLRYLEPVL
jgi:glycosyltransferase involved in cell wall biosynthesis